MARAAGAGHGVGDRYAGGAYIDFDVWGFSSAGNMTNNGNHSYQWVANGFDSSRSPRRTGGDSPRRDPEGHMISVDGGSTASYVYNADGRVAHRLAYPHRCG